MPPNYGRAYTERFTGMYKELSTDLKVPLVPYMLQGVELVPTNFQADRMHPLATAHPVILNNIWPQLAPLIKNNNEIPRCPELQRRPAPARRIRHHHRRAQRIGVRARPHPRRHQLPGAERRGAHPGRHHLQAGRLLRSEEDRRAAGGAQYRPPSRHPVRRQAARLEAAGLLLARRQPQRLDGAHPGQGRLAGDAAGRRLQGLPRLRQHALENPPNLQFRVVCGTTGSGKSRLLETLDAIGAQVLDLERLAAHRGSVLGHLPGEPQPSQKMFETRIWDKLRRFDPAKPGVRGIGEQEGRQPARAGRRHGSACAPRPASP
jgi:hypothetical protein